MRKDIFQVPGCNCKFEIVLLVRRIGGNDFSNQVKGNVSREEEDMDDDSAAYLSFVVKFVFRVLFFVF